MQSRKIKFYGGFLLIFALFLSACSIGSGKAENISFDSSNQIQSTTTDLTGLELDADGLWRGTLTFQPLVEIPSIYTVVGGIEANFDRDGNMEQALVVADTAQNNQLLLFIIDYDFTTRLPDIVFRAPLAIGMSSSLTIKAEDLIGDSEREIILEGFTNAGESVLQIFKSSPQAGEEYVLIFSHTIEGTMSIVRRERSQAYERGTVQGESFPINVQYEVLQASGVLQEYQETYNYSPTFKEYRLTKREETSQNINEQFLRYLRRGKEGVMELLSGPWYKNEVRGQGTSFFFFDDKNERLQFYNRGRQEVFIWSYSSLPSLQNFYVTAHNELVEMIKNNFRIHLVNINTIEISSDADETMELSGTFRRMSDSVQVAIAGAGVSSGATAKQAVTYPEGLFVGERDVRLEFRYPRVIWRQGEKTKEGIFDIFFFKGQEVLQWQFREEDESLTMESFSLVYQENAQNPNGKQSLVLKPISLMFNRIYSSDDPLSLRFDPFSLDG